MLSLTGCQQELGAMRCYRMLRGAVLCSICSKQLQDDAGFFLGSPMQHRSRDPQQPSQGGLTGGFWMQWTQERS